MYDEYKTITPSIDRDTVSLINNVLNEKEGWYPEKNIGFYLPLKETLIYDKDEINKDIIDKISFMYNGKVKNMYEILESCINEIIKYYKNDKTPYFPRDIEDIINQFLYYSNEKRKKKEVVNKKSKELLNQIINNSVLQEPPTGPIILP